MRPIQQLRILAFAVGTTSFAIGQTDEFERAVRLARAAFEAADYPQAAAQFERAHDLQPQREDVQHSLAAALSHVAAAHFAADRIREALQQFERVDELWPGQLDVVLSVGTLREKLEDRDGAERSWRAALAIDANNARALAGLGRLAAARDEVTNAAELYRQASAADPERADYGELAARFGRYAEVEKTFATLPHGVFRIQYPRGRAAGVEQALPALRSWLTEAQRDLRRDLGRTPTEPVAIVLYAKGQYRQVSSAKHWANAYYDGKVRLDLGDWATERDQLRASLRHELAHAFLDTFYPNLPAWLHEGYAQVIDGRPLAGSRASLRGRLLAPEVFLEAFADSDDLDVVRRGYAQSHLVVDYLRSQRTGREFAQLLQRVSNGIATPVALRETYRVELAELFSAAVPPR